MIVTMWGTSAAHDVRIPYRVRQQATESAKQQSETAKQRVASASGGEAALPAAEIAATDWRRAQLRAIASDLLSWKGGLKVLRQAQLPKWRGCFQWQIETKIEALQAAYARFRANVAEKKR